MSLSAGLTARVYRSVQHLFISGNKIPFERNNCVAFLRLVSAGEEDIY